MGLATGYHLGLLVAPVGAGLGTEAVQTVPGEATWVLEPMEASELELGDSTSAKPTLHGKSKLKLL